MYNLIFGGNSFISSQIGHNSTLDDLNNETPSVLRQNEMLLQLDKNSPGTVLYLYSVPPKIPELLRFPLLSKRDCRAVHVDSSEHNQLSSVYIYKLTYIYLTHDNSLKVSASNCKF